jgi:hypothetical protein
VYDDGKAEQHMKHLYVVIIIAGLLVLRMASLWPAWPLLPKSWQRWLFDGTHPPTYPFK